MELPQSYQQISPYKKPLDLLNSGELIKICAPMVRYSKLPFRTLVRKYGCDLAFTPMIVSNSFVRSVKARDNDFTTNKDDRPLIVQFAASNAQDFADAAELISPFADGIDLNCGCPQRWAMQEGYGACLINKPDLLVEMVSRAKARVCDLDFTVSVKLRIHDDLRRTVDLCQKAEKAGVSWITIHGRTKEQRCQPVNNEAIRLVRENVSVPVIANGDIRSLHDAATVRNVTGCHGVMAARGILNNPAMFAGYEYTPLSCVRDWIDISMSLGTSFQLFHHHLIDMLEYVTSRGEKRIFNCLGSTAAVLEYLDSHYGV